MTRHRPRSAGRRRLVRGRRPEVLTLEGRLMMAGDLTGISPAAASAAVAPANAGGTGGVAVPAAAPDTPRFVIGHTPAAGGDRVGSSLTFTVTAEDADGNADTTFGGALLVESTDVFASLPPSLTLANGTATFDVTFHAAGPQRLSLTDPAGGDPVATFDDAIVPGDAVRLVVSGPGTIASGAAVAFAVTALDAFGNVATGYDGTIGFGSTDPAASLLESLPTVAGRSGFTVTFATPGARVVTASDVTHPGLFGVTAVAVTTTFRGQVFVDDNGNGVLDPGESGVADRVVYLDLNGNGVVDDGGVSAVTDSTGGFTFTDVPAPATAVLGTTNLDASLQHSVARIAVGAGEVVNVALVPYSPIAPLPATAAPLAMNLRADADGNFVASLYRAVLGRQGSDAEVAGWVGALSAGQTRQQVAAGFVNSPEHRREQVDSYYETFLRRRSDATSAFWVDKLLQGVSEETIAAAILDSAEYQARHPDSPEFVGTLYNDVLGRQPVRPEGGGWTVGLAEGTPRSAVAAGFVDSPEANAQLVDGLYRGYLHRGREGGGSSTWASLLDARQLTATDVAIGLLDSDEFDDDAQAGRV